MAGLLRQEPCLVAKRVTRNTWAAMNLMPDQKNVVFAKMTSKTMETRFSLFIKRNASRECQLACMRES